MLTLRKWDDFVLGQAFEADFARECLQGLLLFGIADCFAYDPLFFFFFFLHLLDEVDVLLLVFVFVLHLLNQLDVELTILLFFFLHPLELCLFLLCELPSEPCIFILLLLEASASPAPFLLACWLCLHLRRYCHLQGPC